MQNPAELILLVMCEHMMMFWPAENSWGDYKVCEGVTTIPPVNTHTRGSAVRDVLCFSHHVCWDILLECVDLYLTLCSFPGAGFRSLSEHCLYWENIQDMFGINIEFVWYVCGPTNVHAWRTWSLAVSHDFSDTLTAEQMGSNRNKTAYLKNSLKAVQ